MKKNLLYSFVFFSINFLQPYTQLSAQNDVAKSIILGGEDANKFAAAYLKPFNAGLGAGFNNGWFNTAEALKTARFEIRTIGMATIIPFDDQSFDINELGLSSGYQLVDNVSSTPTVFGSGDQGPLLRKTFAVPSTPNNLSFNTPEGTGFPIMPNAMVQLNIGVYKGIEVAFRVLPELEIPIDGENSAEIDLWGFGVKWDFQQLIPKVNLLPFNMALIFGYTAIQVDETLEVLPDSGVPQASGVAVPEGFYDNQEASFSVEAYNIGLLVSKKLPLVTFYGGLRYDISKTTTTVTGNYPFLTIQTESTSIDFNEEVIQNASNPINFTTRFDQIGLNAGMRFKFSFATLNLEGNLGSKGYHTVSVGIGFGRYN